MKKKFFNQRTITLMIGILLLLIGMHFVGYQADKPNPNGVYPGEVMEQWQENMYFTSVYSNGGHTRLFPRHVEIVVYEDETDRWDCIINISADEPYRFVFSGAWERGTKKGNHFYTTVLVYDNVTKEGFCGDIAIDLEAGYLILQLDESDRLVVASTDSTVAPEKILNHFYSFVEFHCPDWLTVAS